MCIEIYSNISKKKKTRRKNLNVKFVLIARWECFPKKEYGALQVTKFKKYKSCNPKVQ